MGIIEQKVTAFAVCIIDQQIEQHHRAQSLTIGLTQIRK